MRYVSVLLRESKRLGKKVFSKTLAVLTDLPEWLIDVVERAVKEGKDDNSLKELVHASNSRLGMRCAESFGAVFLVQGVRGLPVSRFFQVGKTSRCDIRSSEVYWRQG